MTLPLFAPSWEDLWSGHQTPDSTGAVFTRPEVADRILDLAGYVAEHRRLAEIRVLEPSCGRAAFLGPLVERLAQSEQLHPSSRGWDDPILDESLRAADISADAIEHSRGIVLQRLVAAGCPRPRAQELVDRWFIRTDFLLHEWSTRFDLAVGNPPYVRIEALPKDVLQEYRSRYTTMTDRADVYVPFIERGLRLLAADGRLAFIVANRWTKNTYGRSLREFVARDYHVDTYIDLEHTQPFQEDVSAYPAIVLIDRSRARATRAGSLNDLNSETLDGVRTEALANCPERVLRVFPTWYEGGAPWVTTCRDRQAELQHLEETHPTLEASAPGTKIGIGVATGADKVFIARERPDGVEPDRLIELVMPGDVRIAGVEWSGHWLINPFGGTQAGSLVDLSDYPGLAAYFKRHEPALRNRHVARARPNVWYRTIDRIWAELQQKPKLLVRDIQDPTRPTLGLDIGRYYPHHNLYYLVSDCWPLQALQSLLRSTLVVRQVHAHSVQMRGGAVRWQAQTLRRIRIPALNSLPDDLIVRLIEAAGTEDQQSLDDLALEAFLG